MRLLLQYVRYGHSMVDHPQQWVSLTILVGAVVTRCMSDIPLAFLPTWIAVQIASATEASNGTNRFLE